MNQTAIAPTRESPAEEIIAYLKTMTLPQDTKIERVGDWVWMTSSKPDADTRKTLCNIGFWWNRNRGCWQHCGGQRSRRSKGDPHDVYQTEEVRLQEA